MLDTITCVNHCDICLELFWLAPLRLKNGRTLEHTRAMSQKRLFWHSRFAVLQVCLDPEDSDFDAIQFGLLLASFKDFEPIKDDKLGPTLSKFFDHKLEILQDPVSGLFLCSLYLCSYLQSATTTTSCQVASYSAVPSMCYHIVGIICLIACCADALGWLDRIAPQF